MFVKMWQVKTTNAAVQNIKIIFFVFFCFAQNMSVQFRFRLFRAVYLTTVYCIFIKLLDSFSFDLENFQGQSITTD